MFFLIFYFLCKTEHQDTCDKNCCSADREYNFTGNGIHECGIPIPIQHIQQRQVSEQHRRHHEIFGSRSGQHAFDLTVDQTDVGQPGNGRQERIFECTVILTRDQRVTPFMKNGVVDFFFQTPHGLLYIRGDHGGIGGKARKNFLYRRLQIRHIFQNKQYRTLILLTFCKQNHK